MITVSQLKQLLPKNPYVEHWHHALEQLFPDYDINTPKRMAAFIAQCSHESGGFMVLKENLNYKPDVPATVRAGVVVAVATETIPPVQPTVETQLPKDKAPAPSVLSA